MKRIVSGFLIVLIFCLVFAGCETSENASNLPKTASEALDKLFTTIDLMDATVTELQAEMKAGNVTSEQLTQMYIDRIKAYDAKLKLNSIICLNPNALKDAKKLDSERGKGKVRGKLHGIPIVVKANYDVAGMATSAGANVLAGMIAKEDSYAVKKLRDAGAVILAQANMSEFAYSSTSSRSTLGGFVHNAYDTSKTPAGSSGGSAVAVTCSFAAAGIGTDTGGSIRNPSSFANLYGIRPSKGLTSASGILPLATYKDTSGPLARTAEDMAVMLETMAGTDEKDDYTVEADANKLLGDGYTKHLSENALKGMRIGYLKSSLSFAAMKGNEYVYASPNDKIDEMLNRTLANFTKAGAELVDISKYLSDDKIDSISKGISTETFEYDINKYLSKKGESAKYKTLKELMESGRDNTTNMYLNWVASDYDSFADSFKNTKNPYTYKEGSYQRIPAWDRVKDGRAEISKILKAHKIDAVMYLNYFNVAAKEDFTVDSSAYNPAEYDMVFGPKFGLPEISLPMGFSDTDSNYKSEMPLGLSVFSDFGQEKTLMNIAYAYEKQAGEIIRRTPENTPALEDTRLNTFLSCLIDLVYSVDYSKYLNPKPEGKVRIMMSACEKAEKVDLKDPYATYEAAQKLAEAYDRVIEAMTK
ncbi:MAG: hypothetical protein K6F88_04935 [Ruminococcus sp.]|nr:hypothetical protein [Ruminococcus sp.]